MIKQFIKNHQLKKLRLKRSKAIRLAFRIIGYQFSMAVEKFVCKVSEYNNGYVTYDSSKWTGRRVDQSR